MTTPVQSLAPLIQLLFRRRPAQIRSGRAVTGVMKELYPTGSDVPAWKGTVVLASPQGDVHDLVKNIARIKAGRPPLRLDG